MVSESQDEKETTDDARASFLRVLMTFGLDRDQQRAENTPRYAMNVAAHHVPSVCGVDLYL